VIVPDLAKEIASWQTEMKPSDPAFGAGISDWSITSEYVPDLATPEHGKIWGVTCSPSSLPSIVWLTPEDIEAKRAHIMIRLPRTPEELGEIFETIPHELVHVLDARKSGSVADKENTAHSLAPLLADLRKNLPARAAALARAIANPAMARAYRAGDGEMPDPSDIDKDKEKKDAPLAQDGAPDATAIVDAVATNDGNKALEILKKILAGAAGAIMPTGEPEAPPLAPEAPTMGMKPEEAYARAKADTKAATTEGIEAVIDGRPDLSEGQRAQVRKQGTVALARELAATYPRLAAEPQKPTMGALGHPATHAGAASVGGKKDSPLARAMTEAQGDPLFRKAMGIGTAENDGVQYDVPGHIVYIDGSERLRHQREAYRNRRTSQ
jgi:hypothetical protein